MGRVAAPSRREESAGSQPAFAKCRLYLHGDKGVGVLPEEARRAADAMHQCGADVRANSVGPYDHNGSALYALPQALR